MKKKLSFRKIAIFVSLMALPFAVYLALIPTGFLKRATGKPANLYVDAGSSFDVGGGVWKNIAQGGEEKGRMFEYTVDLVKPLAFEYIRIDHVFDGYDIVSIDGDKMVFNFVELDKTISDITAMGAKPFISISYTPPALAIDGVIINEPRDWAQWEQAVKSLVEHISGRNNLNIKGVYYEVWNEPDLFGKFKVGGDKSYITLYYHTLNGALSSGNTNNFKIGGPATTGLYKNWFTGLMNLATKGSLRIDFYSWHRYSSDISDFERDWQNIQEWFKDYPQYSDMELIISETGINSELDKRYDGKISAIHTLATAIVCENKVDRLFSFEIVDGPGPEKYWGRWGILTNPASGEISIKPRYNAFLFMNNIRGMKVNVAGEGSWVKAIAKEDNGIIRLLVVNYDSFNTHYEAVPITFDNLPYNKFLFTRYDFLGGNSSETVEVNEKFWTTTQGMDPNSAAYFEIKPI